MEETIERAVLRHLEEAAEAFCARYGITVESPWTNEKITQALADHGLPAFETLPDSPQGTMIEEAGDRAAEDPPGVWRRTNAMHLLGHVISHGPQRCDGCASWG